ncbi:MAG: hypothetical protein AMS24_03730 [Chlamydiae bacterium SM23_39]|nr:MAG: hypothetical protein AMS24_03730 [Chlamydiae bacterium SM23_39]
MSTIAETVNLLRKELEKNSINLDSKIKSQSKKTVKDIANKLLNQQTTNLEALKKKMEKHTPTKKIPLFTQFMIVPLSFFIVFSISLVALTILGIIPTSGLFLSIFYLFKKSLSLSLKISIIPSASLIFVLASLIAICASIDSIIKIKRKDRAYYDKKIYDIENNKDFLETFLEELHDLPNSTNTLNNIIDDYLNYENSKPSKALCKTLGIQPIHSATWHPPLHIRKNTKIK